MSRGQPLPRDSRQQQHRLQQRCTDLGVPLTVQRRTLYEALAQRDDHPTAEELFASLQTKMPGISKATAYRTLDKLVELGLVRRVAHPGTAARFDAKTHRHHHLVCERCGKIADLDSGALDEVRVPDLHAVGFQMRDFSVTIHGRCRACSTRNATAARPSRTRRKP